MGLAHVAAACDSTKASCINEDNGLLLGIVIAHEVGHVYCPCVLIFNHNYSVAHVVSSGNEYTPKNLYSTNQEAIF